MKTSLPGFWIAFLLFMFIFACNEPEKKQVAFEQYKEYITNLSDSINAVATSDWNNVEKNYNSKKLQAEAEMEMWNNQMRQQFDELEKDWKKFKESIDSSKVQLLENNNSKSEIQKMLPEGINVDLSNVTPENILEVHNFFVDYITAHKTEFSAEKWDEVEILYERLGVRKNNLESQISSADNIKIAEQKVKYAAIKSIKKPESKIEENVDSKTR